MPRGDKAFILGVVIRTNNKKERDLSWRYIRGMPYELASVLEGVCSTSLERQ